MTVKRVEHQGIKIQLLGQIELASERGTGHEFVSLGEAPQLMPVPCTGDTGCTGQHSPSHYAHHTMYEAWGHSIVKLPTAKT